VHKLLAENTNYEAETVRAKSPFYFNESVTLIYACKQSKNVVIPREAGDSPERVVFAPHSRRAWVRREPFVDSARRSQCNGARPLRESD
jgi:hypothetical protein